MTLWRFLLGLALAVAASTTFGALSEIGKIESVRIDSVVVSTDTPERLKAGEELVVLRSGAEIARLQVLQVRQDSAVAKVLKVAGAAALVPGDTVAETDWIKPREEYTSLHPLAVRLIEAGFENVSVEEAGNTVTIRYENRKYRWEVDALRIVLSLASETVPEDAQIEAIGHWVGVPLYKIEVPASIYKKFLAGEISSEELLREMKTSVAPPGLPGTANQSFGRVDITVGAGLFGSFTTPSGANPKGFQLRSRIGIEAPFVPGLMARFQEWIPLNRAGYSTHRSPVRGLVYYTQNLGARTFATAELGRFSTQYTGSRGTLVHLFPGASDALSVELASVTGKTWSGDYKRNPALVSWRHKLRGLDFTILTRYGRFIGAPEYGIPEIDEDEGFSVSLISAFKQREFVVSYADTNRGQLLSVGIVLPLSGATLPNPSGLRIRPERTFNYTYRSTGSPRATALPDIPFTDDWRLLMFPSYLKEYVEYLRPETEGIARIQHAVETRQNIGPSLSGSTGLLFVPTADVEPYGSISFGANFLSKEFRKFSTRHPGHGTMAQFITLGMLPNLEMTVRLTNLSGNLWAQKFFLQNVDPGTAKSGWNVDRMASIQLLLMRETARRPALAVGAQDVTANFGELGESVMYWERYAVMSKHWGRLGVHLGWGANHGHPQPRLKGPFGGFDYRFSKNLWLLVDTARKFRFRGGSSLPVPDGRDINIGIRALLANRFQVDIFSPGLSKASAGLTYRARL